MQRIYHVLRGGNLCGIYGLDIEEVGHLEERNKIYWNEDLCSYSPVNGVNLTDIEIELEIPLSMEER